jgi:hypothetical protein
VAHLEDIEPLDHLAEHGVLGRRALVEIVEELVVVGVDEEPARVDGLMKG